MNIDAMVQQIFNALLDAENGIVNDPDHNDYTDEISVVLSALCEEWTNALVDLGIPQETATEITGRAYAEWDAFAD